MQLSDVLFVGIKKAVLAVEKRTGKIRWTTKLPGGMGDDFVTLLVEDAMIYAYTHGHLYGLNAETGKVLWKNELEGFGYGYASLAVQGMSAPDAALMTAIRAAARRSSEGGVSASSGH